MNAKLFLEEHLFIAIPPLAKALLELNDRLNALRILKFVQCDNIENWHLFYFIEKQMILYEETKALIEKFRIDVKSLLCKLFYKEIKLRLLSLRV